MMGPMTSDAVTQLMLDEAAPLLSSGITTVLVLDDRDGQLAHGAAAWGVRVLSYHDDMREDSDRSAQTSTLLNVLSPDVIASASLVLLRLPPSLAALEEYSQLLAAHGPADLKLVAGGRVKHMSRSQNEVLARSFGTVSASLGRRKCRVLHAAHPIPGLLTWPRRNHLAALAMDVVAHGAVFNTTKLDAGTQLLLEALSEAHAQNQLPAGHALDLGCGSGILATWLARHGWQVTASDVSRAAVRSTTATAAVNGVHVQTMLRDGLSDTAPHSCDLIVTNPPFHRGAAKDSSPTFTMITDAGQVLVPGGELWCVYNSHLPYLPALRRHIGPTTIVARNRTYIVARAVKSSR